ncbi:RNA polymerase sigma factor [Schlesneria paludicola]|uniref:RNA polymerase sigma factor n=1 Tax=Schlesneria paludicola TaxID=360056 RepID=UPI00029AC474|nr:RNA polymerase sigma factor [Schlesneria paludicola]
MNELKFQTGQADVTTGTTDVTDSQLLARFVTQRDQTAFEALLDRHGRMVFGICRRILKRHHESEDAFQATFLSLAQYAAQISQPALLVSWLHRVARHAALKVRTAASKRPRIEPSGELEMDIAVECSPDSPTLWADVSPVLDEELARLSDPLRCVVILCDIEGKTRKDAARQLNWPEATVSSRLMKARSLLADRLTRRGVALSAVTLAVLLTQNAAAAAVPGPLVAATLTTAGVGATQTTMATGTFSKILSMLGSIKHSVVLATVALTVVASTLIVAAGIGLKPKPNANELRLALAPIPLVPPFEEIAAAYRQNYATIQSIRVEYRIRSETLMDPEVLWKGWRRSPIPDEERTASLVIDHQKTHYSERSRFRSLNFIADEIKKKQPQRFVNLNAPATSVLSYREILEWSPRARIETRENIQVYDGSVVRNNNSGLELKDDQHVARPNFVFQLPSQMDREMFNSRNYLDLIQFGITGAALPHDFKYRQRHRLSDLLSQGVWHVVTEHEQLDGSDCVVIESADTDRLWLDRNAGFALRRQTKQRPYRIDNEFCDLRQVAGQIWMPRRIIETRYAENMVPKDYLGRPAVRTEYELTFIELNQPVSDEYFQLVPPEHSTVFDLTLKPLDANGKPIETGTIPGNSLQARDSQPSDATAAPKVALQAQIELGKQIPSADSRPDVGQTPQLSTAAILIRRFVILNLVVLLIAVGFIVYRRRSR